MLVEGWTIGDGLDSVGRTSPSAIAIAADRSVVGVCLGEGEGLVDVDGVCLCVFLGDGCNGRLLADGVALGCQSAV